MREIQKAADVTGAAAADEGMRPGQDLVMAGYAGLDGTTVISKERETILSGWFTGQFIRRCQALSDRGGLPEAEVLMKCGASVCAPVKDGGIMAALWNLFEEYKLGFEIQLRAIPIRQETVEICEVFDLNPYRLRSEGCALLTAVNGGDLVRELYKREVNAVVIGKVKAGIGRQIINGEIRSFLDKPKPDELYRIRNSPEFTYREVAKIQ